MNRRGSIPLQGPAEGFTLIEILISISIIAVLATVVTVAVFPARRAARDTTRKSTLNGIGRFLWAGSCFVPVGGAGEYDLKTIFDEYVAANPSAAGFMGKVPRDPSSGTADASGYRYIYDSGGKCALYANLERADEPITIPSLAAPAAGGGTGVLQGTAPGMNGTDRFYQVSR